GDGTPDRAEDNVASLPSLLEPSPLGIGPGSYVTFESPGLGDHPTQLVNVHAILNPSPANAPAGASFPFGLFNFQVVGLAPGAATTVELYLSSPLPGNPDEWTYWRYGPTPHHRSDHWYQFLYQKPTDSDDASTTGAEFLDSTHIVLHFVDGGRGDNDLTADGVITDPGGPGFAPQPSVSLGPDPLAAGKTQLVVTGTPGNDIITLLAADA